MYKESRDERYFINWFNHLHDKEPLLYVLLEDKERYLKTLTITRYFPKVQSTNHAKALFHKVWNKLKPKQQPICH